MTPRRRTAVRAAATSREVAIVCAGGPWDRWWYDVAGWARMQDAARSMGYDADRPAGTVLGYVQTAQVQPNPDPVKNRCDAGTVWRWAGAAERRVPA